MKRKMIFLLCLGVLPLEAVPFDLSKSKNKVEFLAVGQPAAIKVRGKIKEENKVTGNLDIKEDHVSGEAVVKLESLTTGIDLRDKHMKEKYLETAKFPDAKLVLSPSKLTKSEDGKEWKGPFDGKLTLHGVTKDVKGKVNLKKAEEKWDAVFEYQLVLQDFNIEIPTYLGITVSKDVTVTVNVQQ